MIFGESYIAPTGRHYGYSRCYKWVKTFAWLPKQTISGKVLWLTGVYRRRYYTAIGPPLGQSFHMEPEVEYGDLFDVMKSPE